jgi:LPXTG-motif cell wall-anchored protein
MSILKKTAAGLSTAALVGAGIVLGAGGAAANPADTLTLNQPSPHDITADVNCADGWGGTIVVSLGGVPQGAVEVPSHEGTAQTDTVQIGYVGMGPVSAELYCNTYENNPSETSSASDSVNQEGVLDITPSTWTSGDTVEITGSGFAPNSEVTINLYDADADYNRASDEILHTWTVTADADGKITLSVVLPYDESGNFRLEAVGTDAGGNSVTASTGYYWDAPETAGDDGEATAGSDGSAESEPISNNTKSTSSRPQSLPKTGSDAADLAGLGLVGVIAAGTGAALLRRKH